MKQPRNEKCLCGSGKKFKKCCGHATVIQAVAEQEAQQRRIAYAEKLAKERQEAQQRRIAYAEKLAKERQEDARRCSAGEPPRPKITGVIALAALMAATMPLGAYRR